MKTKILLFLALITGAFAQVKTDIHKSQDCASFDDAIEAVRGYATNGYRSTTVSPPDDFDKCWSVYAVGNECDVSSLRTRKADIVNAAGYTIESDARDVVKALSILREFAPNAYGKPRGKVPSGLLTYGTVMSATMLSFTTSTTSSFYTSPPPKSSSEILRDEAQSLKLKSDDKAEEAERLEKQQRDIDWAEKVLEKWTAKLRELESK